MEKTLDKVKTVETCFYKEVIGVKIFQFEWVNTKLLDKVKLIYF